MSDPRGLAIARQLIEEEREKQTGRLDLGNLGLSDFPPEIATLRQLRWLSLGSNYHWERQLIETFNTIGPNVGLESWTLPTGLEGLEQLDLSRSHITSVPGFFRQLDLKLLVIISTQVNDLSPLANLQSLTSVDCSGTQVSDLSPLSNLHSLTSVNCDYTQVSNLSPLSNLQSLTSVSCDNTQVSDLNPLSNLQSLTSVNCDYTQVSNLSPLSNLQSLTSVNCDFTQVSDLSPLSNLQSLTSVSCMRTQVNDLSPLSNLQSLTSVNCNGTPVSDLSPLANLQSLTSVSCNGTPVSDLNPLSNLLSLTSVHCGSTQVSDLSPLSNLQSLTSVNCNGTQVSDLNPLSHLQSLTSVSCMQTQVSNLSPLSNLQSLAAVHCSSTQVRDLSPLITVSNLQRINANKLRLTDFPQQLLQHPKLTDLWLHESSIPGIPLEVLSENPYKSCLQSLRANFADLIGGTAPVHDVKIIVIGNGRIGKTQICRRLMGQDFDESVPSTHGITVSNAALKMPDDAPDASLNLWDFGGQDLYHGTHSLFMKSRAVFVVVWTPASERAEDSIHGEMRFRNQRLPYWLQYVRKLGGAKLSRFAGAEPV